MIHFNELNITPDGKYLIIDVSVLNEKYYKDIYLESIIIDNQDTYVGSGPSTTPVYSYTVPTEGTVRLKRMGKTITPTYNTKHLRLELAPQDLVGNTLEGLFFVYVRVKGTPTSDVPCGLDNVTTMGTVTNVYPFYQQAMQNIGELADRCNPPQGFTDWILKLKALELAIRTGNYPEAIKYYNRFFAGKSNIVIRKGGCGCGGA